MDVVVTTLTVTGAAGIVAGFVECSDWLFDGIKDPVVSNRAKRSWVFLVALTLVSLEVYRRLGFHSNGDLLGLLALAGTVAAEAITGWSLFKGRIGTQPSFTAIQDWLPGTGQSSTDATNTAPIRTPITPLNSVTPPTGTPPS